MTEENECGNSEDEVVEEMPSMGTVHPRSYIYQLPRRLDDLEFSLLAAGEDLLIAEALEDEKWKLAMNDEMQSLAENNTWVLV